MADKGKLNLVGGCDHPVPSVEGQGGAKHTLDAPFGQAGDTGILPVVVTVDIGERKGSKVDKT